MLGIAAVISIAAFYLTSIRDIDQGIIPAKPGRAQGSSLMRSPGGLTFKLLRTSLIVWIISMFALGAAYGTVLGELDEFIATNEMYQQLILGPFAIEFLEGLTTEETVLAMRAAVAEAGFTIPQLFSAMINLIMGIFTIVPTVLFIKKAKTEETDTRAELILAGSVNKRNYLLGYVIIAFAMAIIIQLAFALGMYMAASSVLYNANDFPLSFAIQAALVYVPAIWIMLSIAVLLIGFKPKLSGLIWLYFAFTFVTLFFGQGFGIFPQWITYLTPYAFVTQLPLTPGESANFIALGIKVIIAATLTTTGLYLYNKRDINVHKA